MTSSEVRRWTESAEAKKRQDLLVELANLRDSDCERFWRMPFWIESGGMRKEHADYVTLIRKQANDAELLQIRDDLRSVWDTHSDSNLILNKWLEWRPRNISLPAFIPMPSLGYVRPNPVNLRVQLVFGVCELTGKLAHCQAEDCPSPYFLRYRDQRQQFCYRPQCLEFGQRLHKRMWARKARQTRNKQGKSRGKDVGRVISK